jgi:hypothetical protein
MSNLFFTNLYGLVPAQLRRLAAKGVIAMAFRRFIAVEIERILVVDAVGIDEVAVRLLIAEAILVIFITAAQPSEGPMEPGTNVFVLAGINLKVSHRPSP